MYRYANSLIFYIFISTDFSPNTLYTVSDIGQLRPCAS